MLPLFPFKLFGYFFQIVGMAVMFYGLFQLVISINSGVTHATTQMRAQSSAVGAAASQACDPKTDDLCGVDFGKEGELERAYSKRVWGFIGYLTVGLVFLFLGLLVRSLGEIGGAFMGKKEADQIKYARLYGPKGLGPFS